MISMSVGLDTVGFVPFPSTFGCFLTRAFDQVVWFSVLFC